MYPSRTLNSSASSILIEMNWRSLIRALNNKGLGILKIVHVLDSCAMQNGRQIQRTWLDKIRFASARTDNMTSLIDAPSESLVACSLLASVSATMPVLLLTYRSDYLFLGGSIDVSCMSITSPILSIH